MVHHDAPCNKALAYAHHQVAYVLAVAWLAAGIPLLALAVTAPGMVGGWDRPVTFVTLSSATWIPAGSDRAGLLLTGTPANATEHERAVMESASRLRIHLPATSTSGGRRCDWPAWERLDGLTVDWDLDGSRMSDEVLNGVETRVVNPAPVSRDPLLLLRHA